MTEHNTTPAVNERVVTTLRDAIMHAWHRRLVLLRCATPDIARECKRILADRLGPQKHLVRVEVREKENHG